MSLALRTGDTWEALQCNIWHKNAPEGAYCPFIVLTFVCAIFFIYNTTLYKYIRWELVLYLNPIYGGGQVDHIFRYTTFFYIFLFWVYLKTGACVSVKHNMNTHRPKEKCRFIIRGIF